MNINQGKKLIIKFSHSKQQILIMVFVEYIPTLISFIKTSSFPCSC